MDPRNITCFNGRLRLPLRHNKRRPLAHTVLDLDSEPPPSYSECSAYFYAPPSYEESVGGSTPSGRRTAERRPSVNRMSWDSDTSTSSSESSSSSQSASSATPPTASLHNPPSHMNSRAPPPSPPPVATSHPTSSAALSLWLSSVSSTLSSPRSVENQLPRLRHRCASSDSIVSTSSSSSLDVITRLQPRLRSWTQCVRWVIQYTLEGNFKSTVAHFQCLVNEGLRVCRQHEGDTEAYPIRLASLPVPRPTALSLKTWIEFILCVGFKFSQSSLYNYNHNHNNNNNDDVDHQYNLVASILENANNNNGNVGDELEDLCVIVPRGLAPRRLMKHRDVLTGLLELPYNAIKTAANMSKTETERIISLLTQLIQTSPVMTSPSPNHAPSSSHHVQAGDHALSLDHALVRSVWDVHRRPGFFLQSLGFAVCHPRGGESRGKCLTVPTGEAATRRLQLAKNILEMFLRN